MILGIDIGGANTKVASSDGRIIELHYVPLWKDNNLPKVLLDTARRLKPQKVAVVITGELADCFTDKETGISCIIDAVNNAFKDAYFLGNDGLFTKEKKRQLAAANWMASALYMGREYDDCLFVDIGSTTTDIIPIVDGVPCAGRTDFERLKKSELVYSGVLRTNIAAILNKVFLRGNAFRISSELFAITADAYMVLGMISDKEYTCSTPDGEGKTVTDAKRRLARVVCADLLEIGDEELVLMAQQVMEAQLRDTRNALCDVSKRHGISKIVACGIGEFIAKRTAEELGFEIILLSEKYGREISKVFPAYAVAKLLSCKIIL